MSPRRRGEAAVASPSATAEREHIRRGFLGLALAHELKQPLHSLNLNVELLTKRLARVQGGEPGDLGGPLAAMNRVVDRINDCLDAFSSRVTPDPVPPDPQPVTPLLQAAVDRAQRAGIPVAMRVPGDLPEIPVHPDQLGVALDALIDNASRASKGAVEIILSATHAEDEVRIEVRDRGIGMTPEVMRRAVEIGFSTWGGSGIGVSVAKFIAYHHAGGFMVNSTPGQGTTVTMSLPASDLRD
jgi:signal transduction histidine kinase